MITIDTRGMLCPAPLIATKRALKSAATGSEVEILTDNETACSNLTDYLHEMKITPTSSQQGETTTLRFTLAAGGTTTAAAIEQATMPACPIPTLSSPTTHPYSVAIASDRMGEGDMELGAMLMRAFINSLGDAEQLPEKIILYNAGVKCAIATTDTGASLAKLAEQGIKIIACGTCVDFFDIRAELPSSIKIANMYVITESLYRATHVVRP